MCCFCGIELEKKQKFFFLRNKNCRYNDANFIDRKCNVTFYGKKLIFFKLIKLIKDLSLIFVNKQKKK